MCTYFSLKTGPDRGQRDLGIIPSLVPHQLAHGASVPCLPHREPAVSHSRGSCPEQRAVTSKATAHSPDFTAAPNHALSASDVTEH